MKRSAPHAKLYRTGYLMSCAVLFNLPVPLLATQLQEPRLFHEPIDMAVTDAQLTNACQSQADLSDSRQPENQTDIQVSELKSPGTAVPPADNADTNADKNAYKSETNTYQYNGFISTANGRHFLINGVPLTEIDALVFVSVNHGGRSLVLKTATGRTFELSVGQSINKDSL